jgi:voltage-gated potassium channel
MKTYLKNIIDSDESRIGRIFSLSIQILIILSLISFSLETIPTINPELVSLFNKFELITIIIFTFEYLVRIFLRVY